MIILLIAGYAGSGKDAFADQLIKLCETHSISYKKYAFADEVKKDVSKMYDIPLEKLYTQEGKASTITLSTGDTKTLRELLIEHSAHMKSLYGKDYWAQLVCKQIDTSKYISILSDWRYNSEIETINSYFHDQTIMKMRVIRPFIKVLADCSEHELDNFKFDIVINNYSTIDHLKMKAYELLEIFCFV